MKANKLNGENPPKKNNTDEITNYMAKHTRTMQFSIVYNDTIQNYNQV